MVFIKTNQLLIFFVVIAAIMVIVLSLNSNSGFNDRLSSPPGVLTNQQPSSFPPVETPVPNTFKLEKPDVPEEIGLAMVYPQGDGVGMSKDDSNSFYPDKPGPLLTNHVGPESYGESSFTDPTGTKGANEGCRVLRIKDTGNQMNFKPIDENCQDIYASAYTDGEVQKGNLLINGTKSIDYSDSFSPEANLLIQTSPGQQSSYTNCEQTYPNVVKYKDFCITEGDIPYGELVDNKVNPRLVSRWESFTGDYSRKDALYPIDGVLYPNLNIITN
jgi:hypothetical protein